MSVQEKRQSETRSADVKYMSDIIKGEGLQRFLAASRLVIGWVFLWAFLDKVFGFGFSTPSERAWIDGGSPAQGYISGIEGPFANFFQLFANPFGDVLFMMGLLGIGIALMTGAGLKIAAVSGTLLMFFMYLTAIPLIAGGTNPLTDSHVLEALLLITPALTLSGDKWGLGKWWASKVGNGWLR